ncbi:hypothetical protein NC652_023299 [Populus alba x Populus x berolinensis]|nr:hypothetical protein NC652_023299 [Populus alba x Populus x berolinensis]
MLLLDADRVMESYGWLVRALWLHIFSATSLSCKPLASDFAWRLDEITAEGRRITKLDQILLNGNNIAIRSSIWHFFLLVSCDFIGELPLLSRDPGKRKQCELERMSLIAARPANRVKGNQLESPE